MVEPRMVELRMVEPRMVEPSMDQILVTSPNFLKNNINYTYSEIKS